MIQAINDFFATRRGRIGGFRAFQSTGLHEFYANNFGPLVYTEESALSFIGVDADGFLYDEIYYPYEGYSKKGSIIPRLFAELEPDPAPPSPAWKDVAERGYHHMPVTRIHPDLRAQIMETGFIPFGLNPSLNLSRSLQHAYFATLMDYDRPEKHRAPDYMREATRQFLPQIPRPSPVIRNHILETADMVKYVYRSDDQACNKGPFSFHMDYFPRLLFMFFTYHSKHQPVLGRELLVGKREPFRDFSAEALDRSPAMQPAVPSPFERVSDDRVGEVHRIEIQDGSLVLMNTLNPMFVHRVEKLRHENEVVLMTHYLWSKDWPKVD
jgi:hypothetical protein